MIATEKITLKIIENEKKYKLIIGIIIFTSAVFFFSDWGNFKAGLFSKPPVEKVQK